MRAATDPVSPEEFEEIRREYADSYAEGGARLARAQAAWFAAQCPGTYQATHDDGVFRYQAQCGRPRGHSPADHGPYEQPASS